MEREVRGEEQGQPPTAPDQPVEVEGREAAPRVRLSFHFDDSAVTEPVVYSPVRKHGIFFGDLEDVFSEETSVRFSETSDRGGDREPRSGSRKPGSPYWARGAQLLPGSPEAERPLSHDVPPRSPQERLEDYRAWRAAQEFGVRPGLPLVVRGGGPGKTYLPVQSLEEARHEAEREIPIQMDDDYYDEVRKAVGRGTLSVLLGTSTRSLKQHLGKLRDERRDRKDH